MKKIKIALLSPIIDDPTSWYRGFGPFSKLAKDHSHIELVIPPSPSWASVKDCDILVLQRPAMPEHFAMLSIAKSLGVKIWVDFDDDNLSVPKDNPMFPTYSQMTIKETILNLARHADVLSVTTKFLKDKYGIYNKNTVIIPNAIDDTLIKLRHVSTGPRENKFLWRGTPSHQRNLLTVGQNILNVSKRHPEYRFVFFGLDPYILTEQIPNHEVIPIVPLNQFFHVMGQIHAKLLYYPLHYNDHSQARSHISWLEGTYANTAVLSYRNDEFNRPGCLTYNSLTEFEDALEAVTRDEIDLDTKVNESWDCIMGNYLLSHTNVKRLEIIQSLLETK